jgi:hypothetical protein
LHHRQTISRPHKTPQRNSLSKLDVAALGRPLCLAVPELTRGGRYSYPGPIYIERNQRAVHHELEALEGYGRVSIKVGDFVQWTSGGVEQFKAPRKVTQIEGCIALVHGSLTGLEMNELTVVPAPTVKPQGPVVNASDGDGNDISVLLASNRLQITADVDAAGLEKLEKMLAKYKEILNLQ